MFSNLGWGETAVLSLLALLLLGPERLPRYAAQAGRFIRQLREMTAGVTDDLRREIGADTFDELRALDPRKMISDEINPVRTPRGGPARAGATSSSRASGGAAKPAFAGPTPYDPDAT